MRRDETSPDDRAGRVPRAGDHVLHRPSGETWVVAYVDGDRLAWCGWPPGEALLADCELVKLCSDEEHRRALRRITSSGGKRARKAHEALAKLGVTLANVRGVLAHA